MTSKLNAKTSDYVFNVARYDNSKCMHLIFWELICKQSIKKFFVSLLSENSLQNLISCRCYGPDNRHLGQNFIVHPGNAVNNILRQSASQDFLGVQLLLTAHAGRILWRGSKNPWPGRKMKGFGKQHSLYSRLKKNSSQTNVEICISSSRSLPPAVQPRVVKVDKHKNLVKCSFSSSPFNFSDASEKVRQVAKR